MKHVVLALVAVLSGSCATTPKGEVDDLKPAIRALHQSFRWKDFRGAADMMVVERQDEFVKARAKAKDEEDLFVTNFELEDAKIAPDKLSAKVFTRISWYRLPSATEKTATVTSVFVWRDGVWLLESQEDGPFDDLKPDPKKKKPAPVQPELAADAGP